MTTEASQTLPQGYHKENHYRTYVNGTGEFTVLLQRINQHRREQCRKQGTRTTKRDQRRNRKEISQRQKAHFTGKHMYMVEAFQKTEMGRMDKNTLSSYVLSMRNSLYFLENLASEPKTQAGGKERMEDTFHAKRTGVTLLTSDRSRL